MPVMTEKEIERSRAASFSVCMGWDAFRLCIGMKPRRFTAIEVLAWIAALSKEEL